MSSVNSTNPVPPLKDPVLHLNPVTIIGPIFIGNMINWLLMGTLIVQVYIFYLNFIRDKLWIQLLVYGVFILDIVQTIFGTHQSWYYAVANWNNSSTLIKNPPWSAATIPIMCGLISAIVQIFYAWRIWTLKNTYFMRGMAVLIVLIAVAQSITAIVASSLIERTPTQEKLLRLHPAFAFWLAGSFVADILITGCMIWILYSAKSQTTWARSHTLINRLITNTIQTGTATAMCACVDLVLFVSMTSNNYHLTPAYILGKLYSNSLMVSLNTRKPTAMPTPSLQSGSDTFGMRIHVSHETERTSHYEREVDSWPGVKASQLATNDGTVTQGDHDTGVKSEMNGREVQVLGLRKSGETAADMA